MTNPRNKSCADCRYWSDMLAKVENGQLMALCLSHSAIMGGDYTVGDHVCASHRAGEPIDAE